MSTVDISILAAGYCTCPEHLAIQGGRRANIRFPAMFALFRHPRYGAMLFDTGYSYRFFDETRRFPNRFYRYMTPVTLREEQLAVNQLAQFNLRAGDITRVFISHFHADHIAALADFPRAKYTYLPEAYDSVKNLGGWGRLKRAYLPGLVPGDFSERAQPVTGAQEVALPPELAPFKRGFDLLGDESLLAVALPGHAAGQMGVIARNEQGERFFFVADAAWLSASVAQNRPPSRMANFLFSDLQAYQHTLADLNLFHGSRPDVHMIPSHCEQTLAPYLAG